MFAIHNLKKENLCVAQSLTSMEGGGDKQGQTGKK